VSGLSMQRKASPPLTQPELAELSPPLSAYFAASHLKQLYRQGWLRRGIPPMQCESVADHTFGVALLVLLLVDACYPGLDRDRALRLAMLHDLGEAYAGDVTPANGIPAGAKHDRERASLIRVLGKLGCGEEYIALWEEYERGGTPEARLVREVDRLEMGLQALVYERQGGADLSEFYASVEEALTLPELLRLFREIAHLKESR
jgi:putative hydrolase of HD superfamily